MADDAELARSFDAQAERYDAVRPGYPPALYDDLLAWLDTEAPVRVVEAGAGTGLATAGFVERDCAVTAVEPGANLAAVLHRKFPAVEIINATFEDAALSDGAFDLVASAQAWHWVDPARAIPQVVRTLRPGGAIALWWTHHNNRYYGEVGERLNDRLGDLLPKAMSNLDDNAVRPEVPVLEASGAFGSIEECRYSTHVEYATAEYLDLIRTWSVVAVLGEAERTPLLDDLAAIVDTAGGTLAGDMPVVLYRARLA